jgi:hypothetical protein
MTRAAVRASTLLLLLLICPPYALAQTAAEPEIRLPDVIYVGAVDVDPTGREPTDMGIGIDLNERLDADTLIKASYVRGANPGFVRAFRYGLHQSRFHADIQRGAWTIAGGELRSSRRFFGRPVVADGIALARDRGNLVGSVAVARPKYFTGDRGGHLFEGSIGLKKNGVIVLGVVSDVARTSVQISSIGSIHLPEDDSELTLEDLAQLGQLLTRTNRLRTAGIDTNIRAGSHTITMRTSLLEQINETGAYRSGVAAELTYGFATPRTSLTASFRRLPQSLPGIELPGSTATIASRFRMTKRWRTIAETHGAESIVFGRTRPTRTLGGAMGVEYAKGTARVEILGRYRDARTTSFQRTRTMSAAFRLPLGRVTADGRIELGELDVNQRQFAVALYRTGVYVDLDDTFLAAGITYQDSGITPPRTRGDVSIATLWHGVSAELGVTAGGSPLFGDDVGAWANADVPLPGSLTLSVGVDYDRWLYATSRYVTFVPNANDLASPWRLTIALRKQFSLFGRPAPPISRASQ